LWYPVVTHVYSVDDVTHVQNGSDAVVSNVKEPLSERCGERDDASVDFASMELLLELIALKLWVIP
jgi:hypothetical protein